MLCNERNSQDSLALTKMAHLVCDLPETSKNPIPSHPVPLSPLAKPKEQGLTSSPIKFEQPHPEKHSCHSLTWLVPSKKYTTFATCPRPVDRVSALVSSSPQRRPKPKPQSSYPHRCRIRHLCKIIISTCTKCIDSNRNPDACWQIVDMSCTLRKTLQNSLEILLPNLWMINDWSRVWDFQNQMLHQKHLFIYIYTPWTSWKWCLYRNLIDGMMGKVWKVTNYASSINYTQTE